MYFTTKSPPGKILKKTLGNKNNDNYDSQIQSLHNLFSTITKMTVFASLDETILQFAHENNFSYEQMGTNLRALNHHAMPARNFRVIPCCCSTNFNGAIETS